MEKVLDQGRITAGSRGGALKSPGLRFYPMPHCQAINADAQRGVVSSALLTCSMLLAADQQVV